MKNGQRSWRHTNLAIIGLTIGLVATGASVRLWLRALGGNAGSGYESAAVVAMLFGVFVATCAAHEIWRARVR
ncbi:hypothetical protein [Paraburkholderia sp. JHI869]|uniref:hypothetical protein n=1 Tax=Paraburkholderia sp. JHI869 TaxID=3112959 RepID=UPI0031733B74